MATCVAGLALSTGLSACNTSAFTKRELVVEFSADTTDATRQADRADCLDVAPHVVPEPLPAASDKFQSDLDNDIRYRIDHADDNDLSKLQQCLRGKPGVQGFEYPQDENN